jgi:hypothetical protein
MSKLEFAQKPYIRSVTRGKKDDYLNDSIPKDLAEKIYLNQNSHIKLYVDDQNQLVFSRLEV